MQLQQAPVAAQHQQQQPQQQGEFTMSCPVCLGAARREQPSRKVFAVQLYEGCRRFHQQKKDVIFDQDGVPSNMPRPPFTRVTIQGIVRNVEQVIHEKDGADENRNVDGAIVVDGDDNVETLVGDGDDGELMSFFNVFWVDDGTQIVRCVPHSANAFQLLDEDMCAKVDPDVSAPGAVAWLQTPLKQRDADVMATLTPAADPVVGTYVSVDGLFFGMHPLPTNQQREEDIGEFQDEHEVAKRNPSIPCVLFSRLCVLDTNRTSAADSSSGNGVAAMEAAWNVEVMGQLQKMGI